MELIDLFTGFVIYYVLGLLALEYFFSTEKDDSFRKKNSIEYYVFIAISWPLIIWIYFDLTGKRK